MITSNYSELLEYSYETWKYALALQKRWLRAERSDAWRVSYPVSEETKVGYTS